MSINDRRYTFLTLQRYITETTCVTANVFSARDDLQSAVCATMCVFVCLFVFDNKRISWPHLSCEFLIKSYVYRCVILPVCLSVCLSVYLSRLCFVSKRS